jgi:hypothetical protein
VIRVWRARTWAAPGRRGSKGERRTREEERWLGLWGTVESPGSLREAGKNRLFLLNQNQEFARVFMSTRLSDDPPKICWKLKTGPLAPSLSWRTHLATSRAPPKGSTGHNTRSFN